MVKFSHVMIRVGDMDRSLTFYTEVLGLSILRKEVYEEKGFSVSFLITPGDPQGNYIELIQNWDTTNYEIGSGFGYLGITTEDVYALSAHVKEHGGKIVREAGPMPDGPYVFATVEDPDGYKVELLQKI